VQCFCANSWTRAVACFAKFAAAWPVRTLIAAAEANSTKDHSLIARRSPEDSIHSEPRPQSLVDWLVWLALWPIVTLGWLVAAQFVLIYVAVGFMMEVLLGIRLRRSDDSDGTDSAG